MHIFLSEYSGGFLKIGGKMLWKPGCLQVVAPTNTSRVDGISEDYHITYDNIEIINEDQSMASTGDYFFQVFNRNSPVNWGVVFSRIKTVGYFTQTRLSTFLTENPTPAKYFIVKDVDFDEDQMPNLIAYGAGAGGANVIDENTSVVLPPQMGRFNYSITAGTHKTSYSISPKFITGYVPRLHAEVIQVADAEPTLMIKRTNDSASQINFDVSTADDSLTLAANKSGVVHWKVD
jgi:hypothetical protein